MSSPRATLTALGLAAVLGVAYWGWTQKLKPARDKAALEARQPFAGLRAADTGEVLLRKTGSPEVLLKKFDGAWRLVKPVQAPADTSVVEGLLQSLAEATREEVVAEKDADLRQFGLDAPSGAVTFTPAGEGAKAQVLFFGNDNPTGAYAYAMVDGKPEVFMTWLSVKSAVLKDADELRDKTVWTFDPAAVRGLRSSQGGGFTLTRGASGWSVRRGGRDEPGRAAAIEAWLGQLAAFRAKRVPSEDGKGGAWGLAKGPHLRVDLEGGASLELHAGSNPDADSFYAQARPGTPVYLLPASDLVTMQKGGQDLADRQAFSLDSGQVERFEVQRPQGRLTALKTHGAWAWSPAPVSASAGAEFDFDGFVARFSGAELIQRLDASAKPLSPTAGVYFFGPAGVLLESAEFGPKRGGGVVALSGVKKSVAVVAGNLLDGLPAATGGTAQ